VRFVLDDYLLRMPLNHHYLPGSPCCVINFILLPVGNATSGGTAAAAATGGQVPWSAAVSRLPVLVFSSLLFSCVFFY